MYGRTLTILTATAFALSLNAQPRTSPTVPTLSAAQIVEKTVAARGGLQAWRAVETMTVAGKMGAGGNQRAALSVRIPGTKDAQGALPGVRGRPAEGVQLPFGMALARPHKPRVELAFKGPTATQVYDGKNRWKPRRLG